MSSNLNHERNGDSSEELRYGLSYFRYSTAEQGSGDSERRQLEAAEEFCQRHGLILLAEASYSDRGISAYTGANKTTGKLRDLLADAQSGKFRQGTVLIVESVDRLGRDDLLSQIGFLKDLLQTGIRLAVLEHGDQIFDEQTDPNILLMVFMSMARGYYESRLKGERVGKAWEAKRKDAAATGKRLTSIGPFWLKATANDQWKLIDKHVKTLKKIFHWASEGIAPRQIAIKLNQQGIPPVGKKRSGGKHVWDHPFLGRLIKDRRVLGEYQPCTKPKGGKREPVGPPIENYFPQVISDEVFHLAGSASRKRKFQGGRDAPKAKNLLPRLHCLSCGGTLRFADKGDYWWLQCRQKNLGASCQSKSISYLRAEKEILKRIEGIDWGAVLNKTKDSLTTRQHIEAKRSEREALNKRCGKLMELFEAADSTVDVILPRLKKHQEEQEILEEQIAALEQQERDRDRLQEGQEGYENMIRFLSKDTDLTVTQRRKLKSTIADVIAGGALLQTEDTLSGLIIYHTGIVHLFTNSGKNPNDILINGREEAAEYVEQEYGEAGIKILNALLCSSPVQ